MNLTPASLKTQRRKVFKHSRVASSTFSYLCVFASLRDPLFHLRFSVIPPPIGSVDGPHARFAQDAKTQRF